MMDRARIDVLDLKPGDRLVVTLPEGVYLTGEQYKALEDMLERWAPGHPAILLEHGAQLSVVREEPVS